MMWNKLIKVFNKGILLLGTVLSLIITFILLFAQHLNYKHKVNFGFSNFQLMFFGLLVVVIIIMVYGRFKNKIDQTVNKIPSYLIVILSLLLFFLELFIFYHTYFLSGWDSGVVVHTSYTIASNLKPLLYNNYFSIYPNNLFIVWIYSNLFRFNMFLGNPVHYIYLVIILQCIGSSFAGWLLFTIIKNNGKATYAYVVWLIYVLHVALNPWISILYSDPLALCFPLLILWLYQKMQNNKKIKLKWFLIGLFTYIGFKLKPQVLIVFIAILIVDILSLFLKCNKKILFTKLANYFVCLISGIIMMIVCKNILFPSLNFNSKPNKSMTYYHYIMMGLNYENNGTFSSSDVSFSQSFPTIETRNKNNLKKAKERLKELGLNGLLEHLVKKTLVVYGDGTYAWMQEGNFIASEFEDKDKTISPFLKSIYYGDNYNYFKVFQQFTWLILILGSCGIIFYHKSLKENKIIYIVVLSLIGLYIFEMLFEARARYLFIYAPFYIISALYGLKGFESIARICLKKIKFYLHQHKIM